MTCKRCAQQLTGKQLSYCSYRCSKLHLKSLSKKRNRDKVNAYKRQYRKQGRRPPNARIKRRFIAAVGGKCERCESEKELDVHHIRPLRMAGTNEARNIRVFCKPCHRRWHRMFKNEFWQT